MAEGTWLQKINQLSPSCELIYRAGFWILVGLGLSQWSLYSKVGDAFSRSLHTYLLGIGGFDKVVVLALLAAVVVYALRSVSFYISARLSPWAKAIENVVGTISKVAGDLASSAYCVGITIIVTLVRIPTRLGGSGVEFVEFSGAVLLIAGIVAIAAICFLAGRVRENSWLYRWQQKKWWFGPILTPCLACVYLVFAVCGL